VKYYFCDDKGMNRPGTNRPRTNRPGTKRTYTEFWDDSLDGSCNSQQNQTRTDEGLHNGSKDEDRRLG